MDDYWLNNRELKHITPAGIEFPEEGLFEALQSVCGRTVFEFGCGYGRLAPAFPADSYAGMDINPTAIKEAKRRNPDYVFGDQWVEADTVLAYTVLLHIDDDRVAGVIQRMKAYPRIVIGEVMGRKWRRPGDPPVFNREPEEYAALVGRDYKTVMVPYKRYGTDLTLMAFE